MRIKVGRVVDGDAAVNLSDLKPLDRIIASSINAYHNTSLYKRRFADTVEKQEEQKRKIREVLADNILTAISQEMTYNKTLGPRGDTCEAVLLMIPYRFKPYLEDVVASHEFDTYDMEIIPPNRALKKFSQPSYLLYVKNKGGG